LSPLRSLGGSMSNVMTAMVGRLTVHAADAARDQDEIFEAESTLLGAVPTYD